MDAFGPYKTLTIYDPAVDLTAYVVVDNIACGPGIGGTRMAADVTIEEVARLARAMTLKNAAAGLPFGGAKSGIVAPAHASMDRKQQLVRAFAHAIANLDDYIPGPDMGTNETAMAWIYDITSRAVGLPRVLGGIPLDEIGATGFGVAVCAEVAAPAAGIDLDGARFVVQGFGSVGQHAARFLKERGARLVSAADSKGAIYNEDGLPIDALIAHKREGKNVSSFGGGRAIDNDQLIGLDCEIWIPAARPDVFNADNARALKAKLVLQGANIPATAEAERIFEEMGVINVPDFIANAGGVICAAVEYRGGSQARAMEAIDDAIRRNTTELLERVKTTKRGLRAEAVAMAQARVREAMHYRGVTRPRIVDIPG